MTQRSLKKLRWVPEFIKILGQFGNVKLACFKSGISRTTAYRTRDRYSSFADDWDVAFLDAADILEGEARRRAVDGVDKAIYYKGEPMDMISLKGKIHSYKDRLGNVKIELDTDTGEYNIYEREAEDV